MSARRPLRRDACSHGVRGDGVLVDERGRVIDAPRYSSIAELCRVYEPVRDGSGVIVAVRPRAERVPCP